MWRLLLCCALLVDCVAGDGADAPPPEPEREASAAPEGSSDAEPTVSPEEIVADGGTAEVWVGVYCETTEPERTMSFYIDGAEVQRIDCRCEGELSKDVRPNCGQFSVEVATGVRLFRMQDDTGDVHAEQELGVTSDRWVTISHREVGPGSGFLTSFDEWQVPHRFAIASDL